MHNENKSQNKKVNSPCQRRKLEIGFFSFSHTCRKTIAQHTHWKNKMKREKKKARKKKQKKTKKIFKVGLTIEKEVEKKISSTFAKKKREWGQNANIEQNIKSAQQRGDKEH